MIRKRKIINILFGLMMAGPHMMAQDVSLPTYPVEPGSPQTETEKKKNGKTENTVKMEVIIILGTNDEIRGYVYLPENITFRHYKNGLVYQKTIEPDELRSLNITKYKRMEAGENKKSTFYQFEPSNVEIKVKDGGTYSLEKIFTFLKSFSIDTDNGRTKLFTIFGDTYEKEIGWTNVDSKDIHYHDSKPHPASVRKILFLRAENKD